MRNWNAPWRALAACVVALATSFTSAQAQTPTCASISGSDPIIYGAGGSAQRDLIGKMAVVLQNATSPIWVVYKDDAGACSGIDALTGLGSATISGNAFYWQPADGVRKTCTLPTVGGEAVDFAVMGNGPLQCPLVTQESDVDGILDVTGPISTVNVVVPGGSDEQSISAEAFYLVYGLGPDADIAPWNNADAAYYVKRNGNSFVQIYLSLATGLPVTKFFGTDAGTNANTITLLTGLAEADQGIGFCSGDVADANRGTTHTLAWQQTGQTAGFWPDSSATAFDKINVRTGLYYLWGYNHLYGLEGGTAGTYADPSVAVLAGYFSGESQPAGTTQTITQTAILNKNVPVCAMQVARDGDLGPIYSFTPDEPCGCYFDFAATGSTTCTACDVGNPCSGSGVCRFGYCEAN